MQKSPIVQVVKKVLPSVVSIVCEKEVLPDPYPFTFFNKRKKSFSFPLKKKRKRIGGGSGFIVSEQGLILTNRHVIEDPNSDYVVILQNGKKFRPQILVRDPINDVAILKINTTEKLQPLALGDSSKLELGEEVIAIGNALGILNNTVSRGVISGLYRKITAENTLSQEKTSLRGLIQTDAAINPGNSGGPLVNLKGEAVGINAAMVYGAENIGFALPINSAKKDLRDLEIYGKIKQPFLGVHYILLNAFLKERFNLPVDFGALVISLPEITGTKTKPAVIKNSPAWLAGIKEGDIILEIDGKKVTPQQEIEDILQECQVGQEVVVTILRKKKTKNLRVILTEKS